MSFQLSNFMGGDSWEDMGSEKSGATATPRCRVWGRLQKRGVGGFSLLPIRGADY